MDPAAGTNTVTVNATLGIPTTATVSGANTVVTETGLEPVNIVTADTQALVVEGSTGNDNLTVNSSGGPVTIPITYNGGPGTNALTLSGGTADTDIYTPGSQLGSGTDTLTFAGGTETVNFQNLAPVFDSVTSPILVVNGTNATNAINYTEGFSTLANYLAGTTSVTWGQVSVDSYEPMEFINKTNLTIFGLAGDDVINLNNQSAPTGLATITVLGNGTTVGDTLIGNGSTAADAITFEPEAPDAGTITGAGPVPISFATMGGVTIDGQGGGDTLTYKSPAFASGSALVFTPGATPDAGTVTGSGDGLSLVPLTFTNLGTAGTLTFATANIR